MILRVRADAQADILDAARWYEDQQPGLGEALVAEIDAVFQRIKRGPLRFRIAYRGLRIALSHRFPYGVYYLTRDEEIIVVGVLHQRRDRRVLSARLTD